MDHIVTRSHASLISGTSAPATLPHRFPSLFAMPTWTYIFKQVTWIAFHLFVYACPCLYWRAGADMRTRCEDPRLMRAITCRVCEDPTCWVCKDSMSLRSLACWVCEDPTRRVCKDPMSLISFACGVCEDPTGRVCEDPMSLRAFASGVCEDPMCESAQILSLYWL